MAGIKYYHRNLCYAYRIYLLVCTGLVALAGIVTLYVIINNYQSYKNYLSTTYVYSTTGASIQVNSSTLK